MTDPERIEEALAKVREACDALPWSNPYDDAMDTIEAALREAQEREADYKQRWLETAQGFSEQARIKEEAFADSAALRDERRLHLTLLQAAWDELEAAEEHHRWHHEQEGRDVEPREERLALLIRLGGALDDVDESPFASASDVLAATLRYLASHHHRTLTNSRLHDPERIASFEECRCLSCIKAAAALRLAERARAAIAVSDTPEQRRPPAPIKPAHPTYTENPRE